MNSEERHRKWKYEGIVHIQPDNKTGSKNLNNDAEILKLLSEAIFPCKICFYQFSGVLDKKYAQRKQKCEN